MAYRDSAAPFLATARATFFAAVLVLLVAFSLSAATLPAGFSETQIAAGLSSATAMEIVPDGRIFVCQQTGQLRVIKNGSLLRTPFLSLKVDSAGERGSRAGRADEHLPAHG